MILSSQTGEAQKDKSVCAPGRVRRLEPWKVPNRRKVRVAESWREAALFPAERGCGGGPAPALTSPRGREPFALEPRSPHSPSPSPSGPAGARALLIARLPACTHLH